MVANKPPNYGKFHSRLLRRLVKHPAAALALHWVFQSLFYMDLTERWFKIGLDILGTAILSVIFRPLLGLSGALICAFFIAHSLNFLFNGHMWGVLKHYNLVVTSFDKFSAYCEQMAERAKREPAISSLIVYGSLARQEWSPYSDLDARLLRKPGIWNGLRACWFLLQERRRALLARFPLDMYVVDDNRALSKLRQDEIGTNVFKHRACYHDFICAEGVDETQK